MQQRYFKIDHAELNARKIPFRAPFLAIFLQQVLLSTTSDNLISDVLHVIHMKKGMTTIRDVDEDVLRKFKAQSAEKQMKMGEALTEAMVNWLKERKTKSVKPKILLKVRPFDWGPGTEQTSKKIDEILYGSKR